ncbi:mechanosensitive ion channel family protein [Candidatus Woesearchaeota archaeon]|nr:mechanosensitive ion channel family protein [Candidatus Woesearchaeota archaeon]
MAGELNQTIGVISAILSTYLYWMPTYLQSLTIFAGFFLLAWGIMKILQKWALKLALKTKTTVDDLIIEHTNKPLALLLLLFGIRLAIIPLGLYKAVDLFSERLIFSLVLIVAAYIVIRVFDSIIEVSSKRWEQRNAVIKLFYKFSRIVIVLLFLAVVLDMWGVKVGPLLAGLGVAGIAIAFALQTTLGNIFGGISLIMDNAYKVGDIVKLESGEMGTVHKVGLRSTKIRTWDNEIIIVPNGKIADSRIQNLVQPDRKIRVIVDFGVEYGSDVNKVKKVVMGVIKKLDIMEDPEPQVLFLEMGDFALQFSARFWVDDITKRFLTREKAVCDIYNALGKSGINIAFPTRTVYLKKGKK